MLDGMSGGGFARRWGRWLAAGAIATVALAGEGPDPKEELGKELWQSWRARQYDLAGAGAETASCTIHVTLGEPPGRTAEAVGKYAWDGEKGTLLWDDAQLGALLARQGWTAGKIDMWFRAERLVKLDGARLTATRTEEGATVRVDTGKPSGLVELRFDGGGVLQSATYRRPGPEGPVDSKVSFRFASAGDKLVLCGWSMELEVGTSPYSETNTVTLVARGGFHVPASAESVSETGPPTARMRMKKSFVFSDWKINGEDLPAEPQGAEPEPEPETGD